MSKITIEFSKERIDEAKNILEPMGLSVEMAMNIFINRVILEKGLPFNLNYEQSNKEQRSNYNVKDTKRRRNRPITIDMVEEIWSAFINYYEGSLDDLNEAADLANYKSGVNRGSAKIYLTMFDNLIKGEPNTRTMKPSDFEYVLIKIKKSDFIKGGYEKALFSLEGSIPYWKETNPTYAESMKVLLKDLKEAKDDWFKSKNCYFTW